MRLIHWTWSAITGLIVGLIARAIMPGADNMGLFMTMILGIAGSLVGGFVGSLLKKPAEGARFLSNPVPGALNNDLLLTTGLRVVFGR
jgi:uncharacterized membrane protein YeaQ/YmgE (transglycosylase-associated protein family)